MCDMCFICYSRPLWSAGCTTEISLRRLRETRETRRSKTRRCNNAYDFVHVAYDLQIRIMSNSFTFHQQLIRDSLGHYGGDLRN